MAVDERGEKIDRITVADELKRHGQLDSVDGLSYLVSLDDGLPEIVNIASYVRILRELALRRRVIVSAGALGKLAQIQTEDIGSVIANAEALFRDLRSESGQKEEAPPSAPTWPDPLRPEAFHGVAGELVRLIEPVSESDPAALLLQILIGWGSLAGRGPYYLAEADRHHANEYGVMVGVSSKARKGTSWGRVKGVLSGVDEDWAKDRTLGGIGSGEALIDLVAGDDHRALLHEPEFARLLAIVNREGSTLSANIRNGWDNGTLSVETRQKKQRVTGAHISVIAHITKDELLKRLTDVEAANGFMNRYLPICTKRSKLLPFGGRLTDDVNDITRKLIEATLKARRLGNSRIDFDGEAHDHWAEIYPVLSEGKPGLLGAITSRAEAHVVRLSLIFSLLDCAEEIRLEHLKAALAVWDYSEASAAFIWGDRLGDPTADQILDALKASVDGLTRWELNNHFGRNKPASEIDRAIGVLTERGLIRSQKEETTGRPTTRYFAV